ncbi:unnamed protein product [Cercopithifilaria johnstoni]|uniref:Uncharacterized protein n=1 Tax=Cercopithifilaria johnstoni TaxID=2874296 RepID=A0A8J2MJU7_9BILA|nr:unnamed protein product [Cercopithifilaria johnstoni]
MSREIYALFISLNMALMAQSKDNRIMTTVKETIPVAVQNNLEEVSILHKVFRIVYIVMLTLMGIIATVMFTRNILDYKSAQKRFHPKPRSPESIVESSASLTDGKIYENGKKKKESAAVTTNSISKDSTGSQPVSDFPTLIPSKSRSSAGQDDDANNEMSLTQKQRLGWDDVEMMRHGLINRLAIS